MNFQTLLATTALVFVVSGVARAAELSTATLFLFAENHFSMCSIVNISTVPQTIRIRIYDIAGGVIDDSGNVVLAPRATSLMTFRGAAHCRFTTVNAKTLFRGLISIHDGVSALMVASSPAQ
jgi:hypothetical protein